MQHCLLLIIKKWKLTDDNNDAFGTLLIDLSNAWPTNGKIAFWWFIINISKIAKSFFIKSQTTNKNSKLV